MELFFLLSAKSIAGAYQYRAARPGRMVLHPENLSDTKGKCLAVYPIRPVVVVCDLPQRVYPGI